MSGSVRKRRRTAFLAAPLLFLLLLPAYGGGPRVIDGTGTPMKWNNSSPVVYNPDQGNLGYLVNSAADELVADAFTRWQNVPLASISFTAGPELPYDVNAAGIPASNPAHWAHFWRVSGDGYSPVIYDADGSIIDDMYGEGARFDLLGVAGLDTPLSVSGTITEASIIINGAFRDGIGLPGSPEDSPSQAAFQAIIVHEAGHFCNLDHSVVNRDLAGDGNKANDRYLPTMYPMTVDDDEALDTLNPDDEAALGVLYPAPAFAASTAAIAGHILDSGGNPFQGAEVVIRMEDDPLMHAYSVISGAAYLPCTIGGGCYPCAGGACDPGPGELERKGRFDFQGVQPGLYTVCVRQIDTRFSVTNGTSVGPLATQAILPGPEECYNTAESSDPALDDPDQATPVLLGAGTASGPYEIVLNGLPGSDPYEPNNSLGSATAIGVSADGQETIAAVLSPGDVDFYSFSVTVPGETIRVDLEAAEIGSPLDAVVGLYSPNNALLVRSDDAIDPDSGGFTRDPAFTYRRDEIGTYKLAVSAYPDLAFGGTGGTSSGPYWLRIRRDTDSDFDGIPDRLDVCPDDSRDDADGDGVCGNVDTCPFLPNPAQTDTDGDGIGDACDNNTAVMPAAAWTMEGDQANSQFGISAATAGDVDGDGYADVIVGAYQFTNGEGNEGRAFLYRGTETGLQIVPGWTAEGGQLNAEFGWSVASAGDVNGDGFGDVIVGAPHYGNDQFFEGRAYLYLGSASGLSATPAWFAESDIPGGTFGYSVAGAGDVNGDGFDDVIVGAYQLSNDQAGEGRAYVYLGSASGLSPTPAWTAEGDQADAFFGYAVSGAGDVNHDGYDDVIVGAPNFDNGETDEGRAYLYLGSASGPSTAPAWIAEGNQEIARFGSAVAGAGDVNRDGYADVIVGAPYFHNGQEEEGRAYLYLGSASGLSPDPAWTGESDQPYALFGAAVATAGDVNGDGYADAIVGAPYATNGQSGEGQAFAYLGTASGLSATPAWSAESDQAGARFGWSVATAGDVNRDGLDDLIVGAPLFHNGQDYEGKAYLFLGLSRTDQDGDGVPDNRDDCPTVSNPGQEDTETAAGPDRSCGTADDNFLLFGADGICGSADDLTGDGIGDVCADWVQDASAPSVPDVYGVSWGDYDRDGYPDLYLTMPAPGTPNHLLRNIAGHLVEATSPPLGDAGPGRSAAWGDYDRDGDPDLFLTNAAPLSNRLFRNGGEAGFTLATSTLGDATPNGSSAGCWGDYDRDGDLDLYVVQGGVSPDRLYRNDGGGSFTMIAASPLGILGDGRSATWVDYDGDGYLDLHVLNGSGQSYLLRNNGDGTFADVTSGPMSQIGVAAAWGDYDNDGDLDVFIAHSSGADNHLLRNEGGGVFTDFTRGVLRTTSGATAAAWGDYDNDGDLDLYVSPGRLFRNEGGGIFTVVTSAPVGGPVNAGAGAAWADYDGDGRLDLYASFTGGNRLLRNTGPGGNHWLEVELQGTTGNRQGIGAQVRVVSRGLEQTRQISGGSGPGQDWQIAHFGLGDRGVADLVIVRWPSGATRVLPNLKVDRRISVVEVDSTPPQVTSVYPPDGSLDVSLATDIILTLSEPVDPGSADGNALKVTRNGQKIPGVIRVYADGMQVTFDPTGGLEPDSDYTIQVRASLLDLSGNAAVSFTSGFDTVTSAGSGHLQAGQVGTQASGTTLTGQNADENSGFSDASVGDVNGDGLADLLLGAPNADTARGTDAGKVRLVFGSVSLQASLSTPAAVTYLGEGGYDHAGYAVSRAGDINGDGVKDFLIGAPGASPNGAGSGRVYLVFGNSGLDELSPGSLGLADLAACSTGTLCGVVFNGEAAGDQAGAALAYAGDVNHDGFADLLIGAPGASPEGRAGAGKVYLVYGPLTTPGTRDLSSVGVSTPGLVFYGETAGDAAGTSVSTWPNPAAGKSDDLLIGAPLADATDKFGNLVADAGYLYAIHGGTANLVPDPATPATIQLSRVGSGQTDQVTGIVFIGSEPGMEVGRSSTGEVDFNGDGVPDVILGADGEAWAIPGAGPKNESGGSTISKKPNPTPIPLIRSLGALGAALNQFGAAYFTGGTDGGLGDLSVGAAGDVNNDGIQDFIIGAPLADPGGSADAGKAYIVYGGRNFPPGETLLSDVGTSVSGFTVQGAAAGDQLGRSVGGGFDVNGDGISDALVGAPYADTLVSTPDDAGESYVISPVSPAEVVSLTLVPWTPATTTFLEWTVPSRGISYNLYRWSDAALKSGGSARTSNATQLACGTSADANANGLPDATDPAVPGPNSIFSYLVTAKNLTGEGPLGAALQAPPRANDLQCP